MSNAYKDWYNDLSEKQKKIYNICMEYPFLIPRDIEGHVDEDFEYEYFGWEIPRGWIRVFLQMCGDIKPILEKYNMIDDFYFIQVKEKYGMLRCYSTGAPREVQEIIAKYEQMAKYICFTCGKPATYETTSWIEAYCDDCWVNKTNHYNAEKMNFKSYFTVNAYTEGTHCDEKKISFKDEWDRYMKGMEEK